MRLIELQIERPKSDKNFPRNIMPQIRKGDIKDSHFDYTKETIDITKLKPVQNQRVKGMHDKAKRGFADGSIRPIIIDIDNYIVNGHHRFDVALQMGMKNVKVLRVNSTVEELIDHFSKTADNSPTFEDKFREAMEQLPRNVEKFVNELVPTDVGVDTVGEYVVHYEGFTDECNDGHDDDSIDDVYAEVYQDFDDRQGQTAMARGVANDELGCGNNPVLYSVYKNVNERNLNPDVKDYIKGKKTKLIKVKVADLDDDAIDDRFGRVIDVDPDVGVDLDEPILLDKDGKTILDGFHRVYQAKRVGKDVIPAEIIDENFADGKKKGKSRPGRVKKAGASCKGSVTSLRKKAKDSSGEKSRMYHWCANMKSGRKKK